MKPLRDRPLHRGTRILSGSIMAVLLILLDQYTKFLAFHHLRGQADQNLLPGLLKFRYLENIGAAFSLFEGKIPWLVVFTLIILAAVVFVIMKAPASHFYDPLCFACFLLISGALGNMIDRIFRGYVIDFIYFYIIDFPVFNLADIYTCAAGFFIILLTLFYYKGENDFDFLKYKK